MRTLILLLIAVCIAGCYTKTGQEQDSNPPGTTYIPPSEQRLGGDPEKGYEYLVYGDYVCSGIPFEVLKYSLPAEGENQLNRTGESARLPYQLNLFEAQNGVEVAGGITCFGCHASELNGELVLGLGNSFSDFTRDLAPQVQAAKQLIVAGYGAKSPQYEAFEPIYKGSMATAGYTIAPFKGVNPAFMIEKAAVAHRNPSSLVWSDSTYYEITHDPICSDVPPWWNVKKKHALYYTALGRGDFTKGLMQVMVVGMTDTAQARTIHDNFKDVLAWIYTLEPPVYPGPVDREMAKKGERIFNKTCAGCHGSYGEKETYPNLVVDLAKVKTDSLYASAFIGEHDELQEWFNASWFSQSSGVAYSASNPGYIAPPLDGIWATAPYLHNGSVPTLDALLHSPSRPTYWRRSFDSSDYDYDKVGWQYENLSSATDKQTYDTTIPGYTNVGHYFGDKLTDEERAAVIEYLKTL